MVGDLHLLIVENIMSKDNVKDWADYQAEELFKRLSPVINNAELSNKAKREAVDMIAYALRAVWDHAQPRDAIDL